VRLVDMDGTIINWGGYLNFVQRCSFKENDVVEIWAIKQRAFPLHVPIVKRDDTQQQCFYW
jgi:hypothetical protein